MLAFFSQWRDILGQTDVGAEVAWLRIAVDPAQLGDDVNKIPAGIMADNQGVFDHDEKAKEVFKDKLLRVCH